MFERFTSHARLAIVRAEQGARNLGQPVLKTEHFMLPLVSDDRFVSVHLLGAVGVSAQSVAEATRRILDPGTQLTAAGHVPFSVSMKNVLTQSLREAPGLGHKYVGTEHLLLALMSRPESAAARVLHSCGVDLGQLRQQVPGLLWRLAEAGIGIPGSQKAVPPPVDGISTLGSTPARVPTYTDLLIQVGSEPAIPMVGREAELGRLAEILCASPRNNALLVGASGAGKTAMIDALARRVLARAVPDRLRGAAMLLIDADTVASTPAASLLGRVETLRLGRGPGGGAVVSVIDTPSVLDPGFERSDLVAESVTDLCAAPGPVLVTTTPEILARLNAAHPDLVSRFDPVQIAVPTPAQVMPMMASAREFLEARYLVQISDEVLWAAVSLAADQQTAAALPGAAIALLDRAGAHLRSVTGPAAQQNRLILDTRFVDYAAADHRGGRT
ncbi:MAG TPA: Clp protease N-terminal domain-containing protein [Actinocrinis sp.]|nr:Clp protease N-terminal domain-containing protein [Actinocrinis sp.]